MYIHTVCCLQQFLRDLENSTGVDNLDVRIDLFLLICDTVSVEVLHNPVLVSFCDNNIIISIRS